MENDHQPLMASAVAVRSMLPSPEERRKQIQDLFDRREREKEAIRKAKAAIKLSEQKAVLQDRFEIDPVVIQMIMKLYSLSEVRRSKVWAQFVTLANDAGLDADVALPDEAAEEGPVFDETKTARRQGGKRFGPPSQRRARRDSDRVTRTRINTKMANEMLDRLSLGLPLRYKPGRPSAEERAAMAWAQQRFEERKEPDQEGGDQPADQGESDQGNGDSGSGSRRRGT